MNLDGSDYVHQEQTGKRDDKENQQMNTTDSNETKFSCSKEPVYSIFAR